VKNIFENRYKNTSTTLFIKPGISFSTTKMYVVLDIACFIDIGVRN
jgi:hypothetical protein